MRRFIRLWLVLLLAFLLVACGGNNAPEPAAETGSENAADTNGADAADDPAGDPDEAEVIEASVEDEVSEDEVSEDEASEGEAAPEVGADEGEAAAPDAGGEEDAAPEEETMEDPAADMPMSGVDPETGLEINPDPIPKGVEFIAVGEVIQMNLTPQTSPEFVIRGPNGVTYRMATQGLSDIFLIDGSQLQPFEYKINMLAKATAFLALDASLSDVLTSDDFTIISLP